MAGNQPFSTRLKAARLRKTALLQAEGKTSLSQEALGVAAGADEASAGSRISHYEHGRHSPDIETAKRIAVVLDVPLAYLYCEEDTSAELLLVMHELPPSLQQQLLDYAKQLKI